MILLRGKLTGLFAFNFWCLFGVYYQRALERGEGSRETKEKISKPKSINGL